MNLKKKERDNGHSSTRSVLGRYSELSFTMESARLEAVNALNMIDEEPNGDQEVAVNERLTRNAQDERPEEVAVNERLTRNAQDERPDEKKAEKDKNPEFLHRTRSEF